MKRLIILLFTIIAITASAQDKEKEKAFETQARELFKAITVNDRAVWRKFMEDNFTEALRNKPFRKKLAEKGDKDVLIPKSSPEPQLEAKVAMFEQLHKDFGKGKITSIKTQGQETQMFIENGQTKGNLKLTFTEKAPYLIDNFLVEIEN